MLRRVYLLVFAASLSVSSCSPRPAFVVLAVEDPTNAAAGFATINVGTSRDELAPVGVHTTALPLAVTVTAKRAGQKTLWVEARDGDGTPLARGTASAPFSRQGTPTATVRLAKACALTGECNNGLFCSGTVQCQDGMCATTGLPCVSPFPCVITECLELGAGEGTCAVSVNHLACDSGEYCNPASGCIPGQGCQTDDQCQDAFRCNGAERCVNFVCVSGQPPTSDDGDICTLDGCNDARSASGLDPVFHIAQVPLDGLACTIPQTALAGVCVSSKKGCVASECGDGVVFTGEVCDEGAANSDAWSITRHCNATCTDFAPYCGDNRVDPGHETCDDGVTADTGNGCDDACQRNDDCGDGVTQNLFEECDDGDTDDCNGCRTDCQRGCICEATSSCVDATWCDQGQCVPCATTEHCGQNCVACAGEDPLCGGVNAGCVCDPTSVPRGSCARGTRCSGDTCVPCADTTYCGQECGACDVSLPVCGGAQAGCVAADCAGRPDFTLCQLTTTPDRWYDICVNGACKSPGCGDATCNQPGPSFAQAHVVSGWLYPDTDQRNCYDAANGMTCPSMASCETTAYCGQDAQYGWDIAHAAGERYARTEEVAGEPVVVDNVSTLMWQGCPAGQVGSMCENDLPTLFAWEEAVQFCNDLDWSGRSDWRLPDYYDLGSIVDLGANNPAIDVVAFPNTPANVFWTSSSWSMDSTRAYFLIFFGWFAQLNVKTTTGLVRCVRGGPIAGPITRFLPAEPVPGEPVVTDKRSGLVWQGCAGGLRGSVCDTGLVTTFTWPAALQYCEGLTWGGSSAWRLPNLAELLSIVSTHHDHPAIDTSVFPATPSTAFWSSSTSYMLFFEFPGQTAWCVQLQGGDTNLLHKLFTLDVATRCVRQGP
jgi:hypothetical protein